VGGLGIDSLQVRAPLLLWPGVREGDEDISFQDASLSKSHTFCRVPTFYHARRFHRMSLLAPASSCLLNLAHIGEHVARFRLDMASALLRAAGVRPTPAVAAPRTRAPRSRSTHVPGHGKLEFGGHAMGTPSLPSRGRVRLTRTRTTPAAADAAASAAASAAGSSDAGPADAGRYRHQPEAGSYTRSHFSST